MILAADVEVRFRSRDLQRLCNRRAALDSKWGKRRAAALAQSLQELEAVERLGDLEVLPHVRVQRSETNEEVVVESNTGVRMRLAIDSSRQDTAEAWKACQSAVIVEIEVLKN